MFPPDKRKGQNDLLKFNASNTMAKNLFNFECGMVVDVCQTGLFEYFIKC